MQRVHCARSNGIRAVLFANAVMRYEMSGIICQWANGWQNSPRTALHSACCSHHRAPAVTMSLDSLLCAPIKYFVAEAIRKKVKVHQLIPCTWTWDREKEGWWSEVAPIRLYVMRKTQSRLPIDRLILFKFMRNNINSDEIVNGENWQDEWEKK